MEVYAGESGLKILVEVPVDYVTTKWLPFSFITWSFQPPLYKAQSAYAQKSRVGNSFIQTTQGLCLVT